ncbi:pseudouridine synthase family protein [Megalodesulfovibrio gigas]|uniref:Putative pseudouridine synthase n=1 Tax=Megalodesulfovibrio gigas (strain ATCC 19364 / DSM 1382 / NCIMB 9332 / VKM B-1759) TaxID=1121448 RepID=T2G984_MEGG1|nr:RluA family pseudouridine synthase [Megalodesulfovibrio gigas]AGW12734.1 putative pseudouridine synthase [Megalodesulfovibrio gigas DSM 1382 = ATCC 19364]
MQPPHWIIPAEFDGARLDVALAALAGLGRRGAHRLLARGDVRLDGRPAGKGILVHAGQRLEVRHETLPPPPAALAAQVLCRTADHAALAKPAGLHTAALAGDPARDSLESRLPALFPGQTVVLCNRLDRETSGIVLAAFSSAAAAAYRAHEDAGAVDKRYHAVVHGLVDAPLLLDRALDMRRRAVTRVEPFATADPLRVTHVLPLRALPDARTLVECRIHKGARHQIRAHLAAAGHPIVGDAVYGHADAGRLMLHHARLTFPGFQIELDSKFNTV